MESASERYYARVQKPLKFMTEEGLKLEKYGNIALFRCHFCFPKNTELTVNFLLNEDLPDRPRLSVLERCPAYRGSR